MKAEDKELLFADLSARVPYGVKAFVKNWSWVEYKSIESVCVVRYVCPQLNNVYATSESGSVHVILGHDDYDIKPYLFPMSSMTDEQREEFLNIQSEERQVLTDALIKYRQGNFDDKIPTIASYKHIDWLNKNHFDYRGLIDKDLAIDATGKNIY